MHRGTWTRIKRGTGSGEARWRADAVGRQAWLPQDRGRYGLKDRGLAGRVVGGIDRLRGRLLAVAGDAQVAGKLGVRGVPEVRDVMQQDPGLAEHEHEDQQRRDRRGP